MDAADQALWSATRHWSSLPHVATNATAAHAVKTWAKAKGPGVKSEKLDRPGRTGPLR